MARVVQLLAVAGDETKAAESQMKQLAHAASQEGLFKGHQRTYRPRFPDEESAVRFPPESQKVRATAADFLDMTRKVMTRHLDLALTLDTANTVNKADVLIDGEVLLPQVPVGHLLYLARELARIREVVAALPVLDPKFEWHTENMPAGQAKTEAVESPKRDKVPGKFVLYEATQYHPAQVQRLDTDEVTGYWSEQQFSGAIDPKRRELYLARIDELAAAVKQAREEANTATAADRKEGEEIFNWILRP